MLITPSAHPAGVGCPSETISFRWTVSLGNAREVSLLNKDYPPTPLTGAAPVLLVLAPGHVHALDTVAGGIASALSISPNISTPARSAAVACGRLPCMMRSRFVNSS